MTKRADKPPRDGVWTTEQVEYLVHDLRSPLTSILTNLQLLNVQAGQPVVRQLVQECRHAAARMERMILNLLDLGNLEAGQLALNLIRLPLDDLVEEAVAIVKPLASARRVPLEERLGACADDLVTVDFDLISRVLVNLLENAVRHSPADRPVVISASRDSHDMCWLYVEDEGAGVPAEWQHRIFERFVQRAKEGSARVGRGLGLAFSKLAADAHGFEIGVEQRTPRGSRFFLRLGTDASSV